MSESCWVISDALGLPVDLKVFDVGKNPASDGLDAIYDPQLASLIVDSCHTADKRVPINIDHLHLMQPSTVESSEAAGWGALAPRMDGLWLTSIEWRPTYAERLRDRAWRYTSAEFSIDKDEKVIALHGLALTNSPATYNAQPIVRAVHHRSTFAKQFTTKKLVNNMTQHIADDSDMSNLPDTGLTPEQLAFRSLEVFNGKPNVSRKMAADDKKEDDAADSSGEETDTDDEGDDDDADKEEDRKRDDDDDDMSFDFADIDPDELVQSADAADKVGQLLDYCRQLKARIDKIQAGDDGSDSVRNDILKSLWLDGKIDSKQRRSMKSMPLKLLRQFELKARNGKQSKLANRSRGCADLQRGFGGVREPSHVEQPPEEIRLARGKKMLDRQTKGKFDAIVDAKCNELLKKLNKSSNINS